MLLILLIVLLLLALGGGVWGGPRYGYGLGWSPLGLLLLLVIVLMPTGNLSIR